MVPARILGMVLILSAIFLGFALTALKGNTDAQGLELCQYYTENNLDMSKCPAHDEATSWYYITAFGVAFIAFAMGAYFVLTAQAPSPPPASNEQVFVKPTFDASALDGEEKLVWEKMIEANGSLFQGDLIKSTGFSKVKLSRILDKLESRSAIERKRRGMANLVVVK